MFEKLLTDVSSIAASLATIASAVGANGGITPSDDSEVIQNVEPEAVPEKKTRKPRAKKTPDEPTAEELKQKLVQEGQQKAMTTKEFSTAAVKVAVGFEPDDKDGQIAKLKAFIANRGHKTGIAEVDPSDQAAFLDELKAHFENDESIDL